METYYGCKSIDPELYTFFAISCNKGTISGHARITNVLFAI